MAEIVKAGRFITEEETEELKGIESFGWDEEGLFYIAKEPNNYKQVRHLRPMGRIAMTLVEKNSNAEEIPILSHSPETEELERRIEQLEKQLETERQSHKRELEDRDRKINELTARVASLARTVDELTNKLGERSIVTPIETEAVETRVAGQTVKTPDERLERIKEATKEAERQVAAGETLESGPAVETEVVTEPAAETTAVIPDSERPGRVRRVIGTPNVWLGRLLTRGDRTVYVYDDNDRVIEENRTSSGRGALAAAAVVGAVAWELLEHYAFGWGGHSREVINNLYNNKPHSGLSPEQIIPGVGVGGHNLANGSHTDFYNPTFGHRRTGVELPKNVHLVGSPGHEQIVDNQGTVIIRHVNWDSQGKLSRWDMAKLRAHGYSVGWGKLGNRLKTIVQNR